MDELEVKFGRPEKRVVDKIVDHLDAWVRRFIQVSPFLVLATADQEGRCQASPRGGEAGFVRVIGNRELLIPDYAGNRLFQSIRNIRSNPGVALLFLVPGVEESARVVGTATVIGRDHLPVGPWGAEGTVLQAIEVHVSKAYYHCGRAAKSARLWDVGRIAAARGEPPVPTRPWKPGRSVK